MGGKGSGARPKHIRAICGTYAGYQAHHKYGQKPCKACLSAAADYARSRYKPRKKRPRPSTAQRRAKARELILSEKLARGGCLDCGRKVTVDNVFAFDLDHRDPATKSFAVSQHRAQMKLDVLKAEIDKCDLLCAFCHRLRTFRDWHHLLQAARSRRDIKSPYPTLFDELNYD